MKHGRPDYDARIQDSAGLIPADEPVFLLRASDQLAPILVHEYAMRLQAAGAPPDHVQAVQRHMLDMLNWRPKKLPDAPVQVPGVSPQPNHAEV